MSVWPSSSNMGTNLIFGEISFITNTTGAILQLACSMDYAIFLLERFGDARAEGLAPLDAMSKAVASSATSIPIQRPDHCSWVL